MNRVDSVKNNSSYAKSYEDNTVLMKSEVARIARMSIGKGCTTLEEATIYLLNNFPLALRDKSFFDIFPNIFKIELAKSNIILKNPNEGT